MNPVTKKKRVMFKFDERSLETAEQFKERAHSQGWEVIEILTINGPVMIPIVHTNDPRRHH